MRRLLMRMIVLLLCIAFLPIENMFVSAENKKYEPPSYMRELSRLVMETASEDDFGEIRLTIGESEMEADGETKPITDDERIVPFVDENDELQIPVEVIDEADLNGSGFLSEEELEKQGYDVQMDESETVIITEPYQQCRLIVKTTNGKVNDTHGATHVIHVSNNKTVLQYANKESAAKAAAAFKRDADVLFCAADGICSVSATTESTEYTCWGTEVAGADQFIAGLPDDLPQVTVAVLDTGADMDHPFLEGRLLDNGWDFVNDDDDPDDDHYHGTHCAGIIRDATPDNVKILPVKVLGSGGQGDWSLIVEGVTYAVDNGADILSMSLGGSGDTDAEKLLNDTASYALSHSVPVIASAGNDGVNLNKISILPACCEGVFTVAAVTQRDQPSNYTNYGAAIDIAAPGDNIVSSVPDGEYRSFSGTSMACPLAAACAALLKSEDSSRTPDELYALLREKARDACSPGRDDYTGNGIVYLGAYRAVESMTFTGSDPTILQALESWRMNIDFDPPHPSDCTVTFSSSDPSVATVNALTGVVYSVGSGTTQITAAGGEGHTATAAVSVHGDLEYSQIYSKFNSMLFLQHNHTAYAYGLGESGNLGYYTASASGWPFRFYRASNDPVRDIERFWDDTAVETTMFSKTDGTVWMCGTIDWHTYHDPVQTWIDDETPMTDAVDIQSRILLCRDGSLWMMDSRKDPYWSPVLTEDGTPLCGVRSIQKWGIWVTAVTEDGNGYEINCPDSAARPNPIPRAKQTRDSSGERIRGISVVIRDNDSKLILLRDGTVIDQNRTVLTRDVAQISMEWRTSVTYTLKNDGTVWNLKSAQQIMKSETQPLTGVIELCAGASWHHALCADGTVWTWGINGNLGSEEDGQYNFYGMMGVGWLDSQIVNRKTGDKQQPLRSISEDGLTYMYFGPTEEPCVAVSPVPFAMQVMENEDTPLTGVVDLQCDTNKNTMQVLYYKADGGVHWSGAIQFTNAGYAKIAVYALPMQFAGQQVYLRKNAAPFSYSTQRVQSIRLDKPATAVKVGDTFRLTATLMPADTYERNLIWKSSDTNVAVVDNNGAVTAKGVGVASIRAYSAYNSTVWGQCLLSVEEEAPLRVSLRNLPAKRDYTTADTFLDTSGGSLLLTYRGGQQRGVSISPDYCTGYDFTRTGEQSVTITFGGYTFTYSITVTQVPDDPPDDLPIIDPQPDKTIRSVWWNENPSGGVGFLGGSFAAPEGSLRVLYTDGTSAIVPLTAEMCSGYDMQSTQPQYVTVSYEGFTLYFSILLKPRLSWNGGELETIEINHGALLTVPDAEMLVYREDGSFEIVPLTPEMCTGYDPNQYGMQTVTVQYAGGTLTFSVLAGLDKVISLSVETKPDRCAYIMTRKVQPALDLTGGTLRVTFEDGTQEIIPMEEAAVHYTPKYGATTVLTAYAEYGGQTASFTFHRISDSDPKIEQAVITKLPDKLTYTVGEGREDMDYTGGKIWFRYSDGDEGEEDMALCVENGFKTTLTVSDAISFQTPGVYTIAILIKLNYYLHYPVTVVEAQTPDEPDVPDDPGDEPETGTEELTLVWNRIPSQTLYCVGEKLQVSDASFYAGRTAPITHDVTSDMCSADMTTPGYKTVTVTYEEGEDDARRAGTLTFNIVVCDLVLENEVPEIEVGKCTRILATFQPRDVDSREIVWSSSDESIATVDEYGRVTGIAPGEVEITAQVKGSEAVASCTVTVLPRAAERIPGDTDGDGEVTLKDVVQLTRYLAGGWDAVIDLLNADVNGDGEVNLKDVVLLRRYLAGGWDIELY